MLGLVDVWLRGSGRIATAGPTAVATAVATSREDLRHGVVDVRSQVNAGETVDRVVVEPEDLPVRILVTVLRPLDEPSDRIEGSHVGVRSCVFIGRTRRDVRGISRSDRGGRRRTRRTHGLPIGHGAPA